MQQTLVYLSIMAAGILLGAFLRRREALLKRIDALTLAAVCALVLLLGLSVGASEDVRQNIGRVGLQALVVGVATMLASALACAVVYRLWFRHIDHEE